MKHATGFLTQFVTTCFLLAFCSTFQTGCAGKKVAVDPTTVKPVSNGSQVLAQVKDVTNILAGAVDEGIALEATLAAQGVIDAEVEPTIKRLLADAKIGVDTFNTRLKTYSKFDATSKQDIAKFADDSITLIQRLNDEGVLRIKNPKSQLVASGIITGARVAARILKAYADREVGAVPLY